MKIYTPPFEITPNIIKIIYKISKHQKGQVFLNANVPNHDTLINTHIYLSVKHNIPLNFS